MKSFRLIAMILILTMMGCSKKSTEPTSANPKLSFAPSTIGISSGYSAQVGLRIDNFSQPIFAASFRIDFNGSKISVSDSLVSDIESIFGENSISFIRIDSSIIHLSLTRIQGDSAFSGSGIICGMILTGLESGVCSLEIRQTESYFYDIDGNIVTINNLAISPAIVTVN